MGSFVWLALSLLCLVASYAVAAAMYPDRGSGDRAIATLLVSPSLVLVAMQLCGSVDRLSPLPLALVSLVLFATTLVLAMRHIDRHRLRALARTDALAPWRVLRDGVHTFEVGLWTFVPASLAFGTCLLMVYYYRSWTWDPAWYHVPITSYVIQNHSTGWIDTPVEGTVGYPRNVELLAAWNCIFQRDSRFDDSSQLPFALLGAVAVATWARRILGASRPFSAALGAAWIALPPVFLQAHSTHVDVACAALFSCALYYSSESPTRRDRWLCYLAMGLYAGTKFSGMFHLAVLAPWFLARLAYELFHLRRGARLRWLGDVLASAGAFAAVGVYKYVQNVVHTGNPVYPFRITHPLTGRLLAGNQPAGDYYGAPPGRSPSFFGVPGDFDHLIASWMDPAPFFAPDVRSGGYGPLFRWLLLPCLVVVAADVVRRRRLRQGLPVLALFAVALTVPAPWWPRFALGAASAGLLALGMVWADERARLTRIALSVALAGFTWSGYRAGYRGFITYPREYARALATPHPARALLPIDFFLWPQPWALLREQELRDGAVFAYDDSVHFLCDLFNHDYSSTVVYVPSAGEPAAYLRRLRSLDARWVGVAAGSPAARALQLEGAQFLFVAPYSSMAVYRRHAARRDFPSDTTVLPR